MKPLVFVHGYTCDHTDWRLQVEHFSKHHKIIAPDLRGHGTNPGTPAECSIETYGADVAALLDKEDLRGAMLVGHSMGCRVVLQAYLNAPHRVAALALVDGSFRGDDPNSAEAERATRATIDAEGYENFLRRLIGEMFLRPSAQSETAIRRGLRLAGESGTALYARMVRWDTAHMKSALAAVKVPLLVIQSTSINTERKRVALKPGETTPWLDLVRRTVPQARIEIVSGVGHFPQLEAPEQVNILLSGLV